MEVDHMITDNPSPRISFSDEVALFKDTPYRSDSAHEFDSASDFDFCITSSTETCLADELFSDGIIRPLQLQEKIVNSKPFSTSKPPLPLPPPTTSQSFRQENIDQTDQTQKQQSKAPFWHLKRSSSLHCDHSSKKSSIWSTLTRSNSTGSVPNSKKQLSKTSMAPSSAKKPPLRKNSRGPYGTGVQISPVLNGPPPCIISVNTGNLFGLGSFFRNGKSKNIKK